MKRPTFNETVSVLVNAYLNDELAHSVCSACVVGNIVAHAHKTKPDRLLIGFDTSHFKSGLQILWPYVFGSTPDGEQAINMGHYVGKTKSQIDSTGYTLQELMRIERTFESTKKPPGLDENDITNDEWMFNGLMDVVDVLADIHGIDLKEKEEAKTLFVKL